ncbi:MAG: serine/threonine protein kinase, partial [Myxococcota bacterium]
MMLLPKTVGPFTLIRKLGTGGVAESYHGILDEQGSQGVLVRRILPYVLHDPTRMASTEARVRDLLGVRHPFLVRVLDWVADGDDRFIVEDLVDGVSLERVLRWCRENDSPIPHNVYLNLATQICNGLEALHGRPGKGTGSGSVLHLALKPSAIQITREGKVVLGSYGLSRSPTVLSHGGMQNPVPVRVEYLSPEQTHPDQKLTPASDIFSLGSLLYEMLTLETLFRSDNNLQTINRIRRVEITTQLLSAREVMPGLDKVLYRALSLNPRHRYQRAFVLREDLR